MNQEEAVNLSQTINQVVQGNDLNETIRTEPGCQLLQNFLDGR